MRVSTTLPVLCALVLIAVPGDAQPLNDDLSGAIALVGTSTSTTGSNVGATVEADEATGCQTATQSVWWSYTAPADGLLTVNLSDSTFDTVLDIWTGTTHPLTAIGCDDDSGDDDSGSGFGSLLSVPVVSGTEYFIRVYGFANSVGDIALRLYYPMLNDDLANATVITGYSHTETDSNIGATAETSEIYASCEFNGGTSPTSNWWRYTAPADGQLTVDLSGSTFDTVLSLYTGTTHPLTEVACNDDISLIDGIVQSRLTGVPVTGGTTYHIRVAGWDSQTGDIALDLTFGGEGTWTIVDGSGASYRFYGPPAAGLTVADLAAQNIVRGVPGLYSGKPASLWTSFDPVTRDWNPATSTGEVLPLGRAFRWKMFDLDFGNPAISESHELPFVLQTTVPPNEADVAITLDTGGNRVNFLANPFGVPLDLTGVKTTWPGAHHVKGSIWIRDYIARSWELAPPQIGPWEMFLLRSKSPSPSGNPRVLTIPASARVLSLAPADDKPTARVDDTPALAFRLDGQRADGRGRLADGMLRLVFAADARPGFDADEDTEKFQSLSMDYVAIGARASGTGALLGEDVRPFADASITLALDTRGAQEGLRLSWDATTLPMGLPVILVDLATGAEVDLRAQSSYAFEATSQPMLDEIPEGEVVDGADAEDRFVLRIGSALALEEVITEVVLSPVAPNPSSGGARVSFALPADGAVRLSVFDVRGREVAVLTEGSLSAGRHDAHLPSGLAAGVYVVRLEAAGAVHMRQAAVIR